MNIIKKLLLTVVVLPFAVSTCFANTSINLFFHDLNDPFFYSQVAKQIKASANTYNVEVTLFNGHLDKQRQINQINDNSGFGRQSIVTATTKDVAQAAVNAAKDNDAQIIFFNIKPSNALLDSYDNAWFVGGNPRVSAMEQIRLVGDYLDLNRDTADRNGNRRIDFIFLRGMESDEDSKIRTQLAYEFLNNQGFDLNPISSNSSNWSLEAAYKDVKNTLKTTHPKDIDIIVSNNDAMALGAIKALNEVGYNLPNGADNKYIPIFGIDGIREAIKAVQTRQMAGTVYVDKTSIARACIMLAKETGITSEEAEKLLQKKIKHKSVYIPFLKIANFKQYPLD